MSLLEYKTIKKGWVDKTTIQLKFEVDENSKEYEVKAILDSAVYAKKSKGHLPGLYYQVLWKSYQEKENTWEPVSAMQQL